MDKACRIQVYGQVQGTGFRVAARAKAQELGVKGIVRNQLNGGVYLEVEGDSKNVSQFTQWCKSGPESANVGEVSVQSAKPGKYYNFKITE